jgi:circadian clock protein KaiC
MNEEDLGAHDTDVLEKSPTGIEGLDEITFGGFPRGRPTLVCGSAGSGKTMLATEFLVRGAAQFGEPGVFIAFEETAADLAKNARSLGFDLAALERQGKLIVDYVHVERAEIEATGAYDLEGLFLRIGFAADTVGARRVVLDTLEALFSALPDEFTVRAELRRLFRWLKDRGLTAVITAERGETSLTRYGLEEYVSDCVILLDHRVNEQLTTRRLRIVKYRGSKHGTNEYPFLISETGFEVLPITSIGLEHEAVDERVSTGIAALDEMLGGEGVYRGSSVLLSGTAGTGKSSVAATFVDAACRRRERAFYFSFEESSSQILRNMRSIGLDLKPWTEQGLLKLAVARPTAYGLESHLALIDKAVKAFEPSVVVVDPISSFLAIGNVSEAHAMLTRLVDLLKARRITAVFVSLTHPGQLSLDVTDTAVSSIIDTWLLLRELEQNGERNRALYVLKSRGTSHSNQVREFRLSSKGVELVDVYLGPEGVLVGSARAQQIARDKLAELDAQIEIERQEQLLEQRRSAMEAQIAATRAEFGGLVDDLERRRRSHQARASLSEANRAAVTSGRRTSGREES